MPNTIHDHETNAANRQVTITADEPDANNGNASHVYEITALTPDGAPSIAGTKIWFQHGPIAEVGVNGITNEALLAIVIDRLRGFQSSKYACRENALALTKLEEALQWLHWRTRGREARGVEGTHTL